jgi:cell wall-associated NlpC family hydrolase
MGRGGDTAAAATEYRGRALKFIAAVFVILAIMLSVGVSVAVMPFAMLFGTISVAPPGHVPPEALPAPAGPLLSDSSDLAAQIQPWLGSRYVFGGNVIGAVDCSGLVVGVERALGVSMPRTAQTQFNATTRIDASQLQPGDLVFFAGTYDSRPDFISHVGIYVGNGWMVSAIEPVVSRQQIDSPYWRSHYAGAGRIRR